MEMKTIYAPENLSGLTGGPHVFLAGPTPRTTEASSWRPEALQVFHELGFDGTVLVPEDRSGVFRCTYDDQVEWEERGLYACDCIMFWVPRSFPHMPGMTTNDEWGFWKRSGKVVWGNPPEAERVTYQRYYAKKFCVPTFDDLKSTVAGAIDMAQRLASGRRDCS